MANRVVAVRAAAAELLAYVSGWRKRSLTRAAQVWRDVRSRKGLAKPTATLQRTDR